MCSIEYLTIQIELVLPTFKSRTVHKIIEYLTLGLLLTFEMHVSITVQQLTFFDPPCRCGMLLRTSHVPWSACPCVLGTRVSPAKTVEPIEVPFKGADSCIRLHKRICWRQQANTIKQSVSGGVALRQSTRLIIPPYITPSSETHSTPAYSHLNRLVHQSMFRILRPQYRKQSIVMRMSVCLYVRTRADQETSPIS